MNGSALARFGIGILIACFAAPGVALADTPTLNPSGTLTFSWRGDPARGCEAAGVCAVSGSLELIPADQSGASETPPSRTIQIQDDISVVRVTDPGSTPSQPHVCTQPVPVSMVLFVMRRRQSRELEAIALAFSGPSSGDCAGPSPLSLGNFTLPVRRLAGPREAYDLSGAQTFGSGPYEVTVKSTIRARRPAGTGNGGVGSSSSGTGFPFPKPHKGLIEGVSEQYRVTSTSGTITTTFAGRPDPFCVPLDACGASGTLTDSISGISGRLEFDAQRVVTRRASRRAALADFRSGRLPLQDSAVLLKDVLSATVGWPAGSACTDRVGQHNAVDLSVEGARGGQNVRFSLATNQPEDPFRSECPGPAASDVLGSSDALARASVPLRALGRRRLRIVVSGHGRFVAASYTGARSGGVTLELRLLRVRAGTVTAKVFPGEP
ncbi:MAG: hypothetical protein ACXVHB_05750 [Solirubrobacteraceae bacterium]